MNPSGPNKKARWKSALADASLCLVLTFLVAANIWRDPSPWVDPFFQSGRFDAQVGIVGTYIQAAQGERVDCLVWPGLPGIARGALLLKTMKDDTSSQQKLAEPAGKLEFYSLLARASAWSNTLAVPGMLALVLATFWFVGALGNSRLLAFSASAYLAVSQMCSTQIGWARTEAWSVAFLALAMLVILPDIKRWLWCEQPQITLSRPGGMRVVVFGFLVSSAILDKVLVAPAAVCLSVFFLWISQKNPGHALASAPSRKEAVVWCFFPLFLCPWWALSFPSKEFWITVSMYDASSADLLGPVKWSLFAAAIVLFAVLPAFFFAVFFFCKRYWNVDGTRMQALLPSVNNFARLISGCLIALYFWAAVISPNITYFKDTVNHVLVMLAASVLGASPYAQAQSGFLAAFTYFWNSGAELGRPNLLDFADAVGFAVPALRWVNPASISLVIGLSAIALIVAKRHSSPVASKFALLATLFFALMFLSDFLASTRGALGLDFRYYIYSGWFGLIGIALFFSSLRTIAKSRATSAISVILALFVAAVVLFGFLAGTPSGNQQALFGRQIHIGALTAPNVFRKAGIVPDTSDWRLFFTWHPVDAGKDLANLLAADPAAAARFKVEPSAGTEVSVRCLQADKPDRLQLRNPIEIDSQPAEQCTLALSGYLQSTSPERIPSIGLVVESKETGKVTQYRWAIVSSAWGPEDEPVEYAVAVPFRPSTERAFLLVDWAPSQAGETMSIHELSIGLMSRTGLLTTSSGATQHSSGH